VRVASYNIKTKFVARGGIEDWEWMIAFCGDRVVIFSLNGILRKSVKEKRKKEK
jgi:hypothetical protein